MPDNLSFLPLSFFTSLFGINAREWSGEQTNPTLAQMFEIAGPFRPRSLSVLQLTFPSPYILRHHRSLPPRSI